MNKDRIISLIGGVAIGGAASLFITKRYFTKKFDEELNKEFNRLREDNKNKVIGKLTFGKHRSFNLEFDDGYDIEELSSTAGTKYIKLHKVIDDEVLRNDVTFKNHPELTIRSIFSTDSVEKPLYEKANNNDDIEDIKDIHERPELASEVDTSDDICKREGYVSYSKIQHNKDIPFKNDDNSKSEYDYINETATVDDESSEWEQDGDIEFMVVDSIPPQSDVVELIYKIDEGSLYELEDGVEEYFELEASTLPDSYLEYWNDKDNEITFHIKDYDVYYHITEV